MNFTTIETTGQLAFFTPTQDEHEMLVHALTIQADLHEAGRVKLRKRQYEDYLAYLCMGEIIATQDSIVEMQPQGFVDFAYALEFAADNNRFGKNEKWLARVMAGDLRDYADDFLITHTAAELTSLLSHPELRSQLDVESLGF